MSKVSNMTTDIAAAEAFEATMIAGDDISAATSVAKEALPPLPAMDLLETIDGNVAVQHVVLPSEQFEIVVDQEEQEEEKLEQDEIEEADLEDHTREEQDQAAPGVEAANPMDNVSVEKPDKAEVDSDPSGDNKLDLANEKLPVEAEEVEKKTVTFSANNLEQRRSAPVDLDDYIDSEEEEESLATEKSVELMDEDHVNIEEESKEEAFPINDEDEDEDEDESLQLQTTIEMEDEVCGTEVRLEYMVQTGTVSSCPVEETPTQGDEEEDCADKELDRALEEVDGTRIEEEGSSPGDLPEAGLRGEDAVLYVKPESDLPEDSNVDIQKASDDASSFAQLVVPTVDSDPDSHGAEPTESLVQNTPEVKSDKKKKNPLRSFGKSFRRARGSLLKKYSKKSKQSLLETSTPQAENTITETQESAVGDVAEATPASASIVDAANTATVLVRDNVASEPSDEEVLTSSPDETDEADIDIDIAESDVVQDNITEEENITISEKDDDSACFLSASDNKAEKEGPDERSCEVLVASEESVKEETTAKEGELAEDSMESGDADKNAFSVPTDAGELEEKASVAGVLVEDASEDAEDPVFDLTARPLSTTAASTEQQETLYHSRDEPASQEGQASVWARLLAASPPSVAKTRQASRELLPLTNVARSRTEPAKSYDYRMQLEKTNLTCIFDQEQEIKVTDLGPALEKEEVSDCKEPTSVDALIAELPSPMISARRALRPMKVVESPIASGRISPAGQSHVSSISKDESIKRVQQVDACDESAEHENSKKGEVETAKQGTKSQEDSSTIPLETDLASVKKDQVPVDDDDSCATSVDSDDDDDESQEIELSARDCGFDSCWP